MPAYWGPPADWRACMCTPAAAGAQQAPVTAHSRANLRRTGPPAAGPSPWHSSSHEGSSPIAQEVTHWEYVCLPVLILPPLHWVTQAPGVAVELWVRIYKEVRSHKSSMAAFHCIVFHLQVNIDLTIGPELCVV